MNKLLNDPLLNELTDQDWNQVQQILNRKKPSVPFSKATLQDCVRFDGLNLNIDNVTLKAPTLHIPTSFSASVASDFVCENLSRIKATWVLDNDRACRMLINAILLEALKSEANENLVAFCEVKNDWEGTGFGYTGNVDYMLGTSKIKSVDNMDSLFLVVQASKECPESKVPQVLAQAGCLLRKRLAAGKKTPVFAVLTNGYFFRFFAIETDGVVYASEEKVLEIGKDGTYHSSSSLSDILGWLIWFVTAVKSISPAASGQDLTVENIEDSLTQLRNCFGPKSPISSKKLKTQK
jgi:hypothetical protein